MNLEEFHKYGVHFCNLSENIFNEDEIYALENTPINQKALRILSQYLVGNITLSLEEIHKMQKQNRRNIFQVWLDIVDDSDTLKSIGRSIIEDYI
jgi:hypothetical protein